MGKSPLVRKLYHDRLELHRLDSDDTIADFKNEVARGLSATPKRIPPKFFYDERGSELFEQITKTEEYYPTRTETWILDRYNRDIIQASGQHPTLVEFGSGSSAKTRLLLDILAESSEELVYIPIDISPSIVHEHSQKLLEDYANLNIRGLICDYQHALDELSRHTQSPKLFLFLGSTIGNFEPDQASEFLAAVQAAMGAQDHLLLGVDLVKAPEILNRAYNDAGGVTAAFNLNLLARINRELGGRFDLNRFRHRAFFNEVESRIEMHLESLGDQKIEIEALGSEFSFAGGETIHTENSYKYNYLSLERVIREAGLRIRHVWHDPEQWFALNLLAPA